MRKRITNIVLLGILVLFSHMGLAAVTYENADIEKQKIKASYLSKGDFYMPEELIEQAKTRFEPFLLALGEKTSDGLFLPATTEFIKSRKETRFNLSTALYGTSMGFSVEVLNVLTPIKINGKDEGGSYEGRKVLLMTDRRIELSSVFTYKDFKYYKNIDDFDDYARAKPGLLPTYKEGESIEYKKVVRETFEIKKGKLFITNRIEHFHRPIGVVGVDRRWIKDTTSDYRRSVYSSQEYSLMERAPFTYEEMAEARRSVPGDRGYTTAEDFHETLPKVQQKMNAVTSEVYNHFKENDLHFFEELNREFRSAKILPFRRELKRTCSSFFN